MTAASIEVGVSVEARAHLLVRELVTMLEAEFGLRIEDVQITWLDAGSVSGPAAIVNDIRLVTRTR